MPFFSPYVWNSNTLFLLPLHPSFHLLHPPSLGDGEDPEPPARLRLPPRPRAVGLRQRPDGHEERVLRPGL